MVGLVFVEQVNDMKLSVCIATMNRADVIGETLESIVSQARDDVEISQILDGASTDNTREVVEGYRKQRFPALRYVRASSNGAGRGQGFRSRRPGSRPASIAG